MPHGGPPGRRVEESPDAGDTRPVWLGVAITVLAVVLLIYAALRRPRPRDADDPWWIKFLEWIHEKLGAVGLVAVLLLVLGLFLTAYGWSPTMLAAWIETIIKLFGNSAGNSTTPSPS